MGSRPSDEDRGAGDGSRTRVTSLEGWRSTVELRPQRESILAVRRPPVWSEDPTGEEPVGDRQAVISVGEGGFEPPTSCSQSHA